jgi:predicted negative regulator of RcsB-dependent stress response
MPILALLANRFVIVGLAFALLGAWGAWNRHQFNAVTAEYEAFKVATQAAGIAAEHAAAVRAAFDKANQEKTDADHAKAVAALAADNKRLRDARSSSSNLPPAAPGAVRPDRITFDWAELDAAIRQLDAGVSSLVEQGDSDGLSLNLAKSWALRMSTNLSP